MIRSMIAVVVAVTTVGCAGFREKINSPGVTASRVERSAQMVHDFEERRDAAQLAAALDRLNQGDAARAESMLAALVKRRPDFSDARLHLAEILWSHGDASAEQHLRAILESHPNRPDVHHTLGLLLSATNREGEARHHLSKATELEPENEVFRATYESLASAPASTRY